MTNTGPVVVCYETDTSSRGLHRLLRSLEKWGWDHNVVTDRKWLGSGRRLKEVAKHCRALVGRYTHVIHVDSRDVVCTGPRSEWVPPSCPLLLSAELNCWPDQSLADRYPPNPLPWRFPHSQFVLSLKHCDVLDLDGLEDGTSDQLHLHRLYLKNTGDIAIDHSGKYVQSVLRKRLDGTEIDHHFEVVDGRVVNKLTGERPLVCHANGLADLSWIEGGSL